jgi:hypothetical protein
MVSLALFIVGAGLCVDIGKPLPASPTGDASPAEAPTYFVGDKWRFSNGVAVSVKRIDENGVTFAGGFNGCRGCEYRVKDGRLGVFGPDGGPLENLSHHGFVPAAGEWKWWEFPMSVGKSWQFSGLAYRWGRAHHVTVKTHIWSYEDVKTPAGVFKAFRLGRQTDYLNPDGGFTVEEAVWYAPAVKWTVKSQANGGNWELVDYSVK